MATNNAEVSSSGHRLGLLIGDWFEKYFVLPLLEQVSEQLSLHLDSRFTKSASRQKTLWADEDGNIVDFDFVLELRKNTDERGIPVAFIESCWRRGERHSKDKARDDSGKLLPMQSTFPTARFLGMVVGGDFSEPARILVRSRNIDLFYVPKNKIIEAFQANGLEINYPDKLSESEKTKLADKFIADFTPEKRLETAKALVELVGDASVLSYVDRVRARLSALPQEIRIIVRQESAPLVFKSILDATNFLMNPSFQVIDPIESYVYQITYSDGSEFERVASSIEQLNSLHNQVRLLSEHINNLKPK